MNDFDALLHGEIEIRRLTSDRDHWKRAHDASVESISDLTTPRGSA